VQYKLWLKLKDFIYRRDKGIADILLPLVISRGSNSSAESGCPQMGI
jgi:hypothetical protein